MLWRVIIINLRKPLTAFAWLHSRELVVYSSWGEVVDLGTLIVPKSTNKTTGLREHALPVLGAPENGRRLPVLEVTVTGARGGGNPTPRQRKVAFWELLLTDVFAQRSPLTRPYGNYST